ncbi:hypothetical protein BRC81_13880 [Halobacteriales archaeon QS_1_68_20]|nr:MAG: hypothetical protein BRC81_13880 [Halobacteriales archaeon QS_1_68_20]
MLRVVLAVLLAVALLGVTVPAVEDARVERSATIAEGELAAFETAVQDLVATEDPAPDAERAARRTLTLDVPTRTFTTARVAFVALGGLPDRTIEPVAGTVIAYQLQGTTYTRRLPVPVRVLEPDGDLGPAGEPLVVRGTTRVTLLLLERGGDPVVAVTDGDPDAG